MYILRIFVRFGFAEIIATSDKSLRIDNFINQRSHTGYCNHIIAVQFNMTVFPFYIFLDY